MNGIKNAASSMPTMMIVLMYPTAEREWNKYTCTWTGQVAPLERGAFRVDGLSWFDRLSMQLGLGVPLARLVCNQKKGNEVVLNNVCCCDRLIGMQLEVPGKACMITRNVSS
jgi:hypothetical protein